MLSIKSEIAAEKATGIGAFFFLWMKAVIQPPMKDCAAMVGNLSSTSSQVETVNVPP